MRNRVYGTYLARSRCKIPMKLQLFAEGGDGGDGGGGSGNDDPVGGSEGSGAGQNDLSFDDFLKTGGNQAEFDRRVQKAIDTAVSKAKEQWQVLADDKVSEAEKLAKMTAAEKQTYLNNKRQKELDDREAEITRKELKATAKNTLADKKLPQDLADILVYTSAEDCNKSIEAVEKAFNAAVEEAVKERLKGGEPMKKGGSDADTLEKQIETAMMRGLYG